MPARFCLWLHLAILLVPAALHGQQPASRPAQQDIAALVQRLGDPSFATRTDATRRLCEIGPAARPALEEAVRGPDAEVALRARSLLKALDNIFFGGCRVELAVSRSQIAWDDSLDLRLTVRNDAEFAAAIPLEQPDAMRDRLPPLTRQACMLLDLADFLKVTGPDGAEVEFHIDALTAEPALESAVRERSETGPSSRLPAREEQVWTAVEFNRGWARYALLRPGRYRVQLVYIPEWDDPELVKAAAGAVRSNEVEVTVTEPAPPGVEGPNAPARLVLARQDAAIVARLENPSDLPISINTNFAAGGPPFANFRWVVWAKDDWRDALALRDDRPPPRFERERIIEVPAGGSHVLGRAEIAALRDTPGVAADAPLFVRAIYSNFFDAAWHRAQDGALPEELRAPPPLRMATLSAVAEPVRID